MTPRPADEARRALREARGRGEPTSGDGEHGATSPPRSPSPSAPAPAPAEGREGASDRPPGDPSPSRPGDIARAALRSARTARHAGEHDPADLPDPPPGAPDASDEPDADNAPDAPTPSSLPAGSAAPADRGVPGGPVAPDVSTDRAVPTGSEGPGPDGEPAAPGEKSGRTDDTTEPDSPAGASLPGSVGARAARPADVAREALRAARRQAKADAASEGGSANSAAPARRSSRSAGSRRRPHGPGTADARVRAVRDFAAGAFRLPSEAGSAEEVLPAGELAGGSVAEGSAVEGRGVARPEPGPSSGADHTVGALGADRSDVTAGADHAAGAAGADRAVGDSRIPGGAFASSQDGYAARSGGAGSDGEWARRAQRQPSAVRGQDLSASAAQPRAPRSMAAPDRDGDLRRTFAALPPREAADEGFAGTWWGNAWVTALEEGALDAARLERGRGYAERGHVDAITVTPGLVLAYVQGSRARPYRVQVRLRTLGDADWDRFLDAAVERPGHIAALLDKELPHSLADLADHGVPLLPGPGDLTPQCSCPDSGHPCKHAAALCYQTARLLDADPFVLLLLRGRGERALLDALSRRNATRAARAAQDRGPAPLPGVRAGEALTPRALPPLPPPLPAPPHPEQPPAYPAAPGGPDPFALDQLATDAAARAHALLTTGRDPVGGLTLWQDAVRLAAARPGSGLTAGTRALYASLASAAGRDTAELARAVAAWRQGGPEGLDVLEEPWDPPAGRFDRARPLLLAADLPAFRPWRNRLTHPRGHVQLRLGRVGLWYAYESEPGREDWWPRGTPDLDPVGALTGIGTRVDL
ncbi:SWIM zinc finger family protein [Streptomyces tendae]|uniref:SWIM zinc finger family protein n=1 Tax=Streptomyces tendae TaxID=1932 RepID=UPI0037F59CF2